jgi:CheY-like chemotaxis protein
MPTPLQILLADDSLIDVVLFRRAIDRTGLAYSLETVTDGELAIKYLQGEGEYSDRVRFPLPDCVILDVHMPKRSGLEVLDWIRNDPRFRDATVIMLSALAGAGDTEKAYRRGISAFLRKPIQPDDLKNAIVAALNVANPSPRCQS